MNRTHLKSLLMRLSSAPWRRLGGVILTHSIPQRYRCDITVRFRTFTMRRFSYHGTFEAAEARGDWNGCDGYSVFDRKTRRYVVRNVTSPHYRATP